ncbi:hypothetical protein DY000_02006756 [Brassica cretica]|uniref:DUF223 domain-containing protein n=1 Tax=Brassica cretica TaxID=69181 RepID=A0ABQ7C768_BRACR|nr:hypothetical protein DY000_02006756 [Brassica cretica]
MQGTKMEMTIYSGSAYRFRDQENQEGQWVEIFRVEFDHVYQGFNTTNSRFKLSATPDNKFHIIDPLNNHLYMEFKCIHDIPHIRNINYPMDIMGVVFNTEVHFDDPARPNMSEIKCVATGDYANAFRDGFENIRSRGGVIVVLKTWRSRRYLDDDDKWHETKGRLSDFRFNPRLPQVEEFRQSLLNSDPYDFKSYEIALIYFLVQGV